jgi:stage II sporulation protein D
MRSSPRYGLVNCLVLLVLGAGCAPEARRVATPPVERGRIVRVGLAIQSATLALRTRGGWDGRAGEARWSLPQGTLRVLAFPDRVVAIGADGVEHADARSVRFLPRDDGALLYVGDIPYRGAFEVRLDGGRLTLIETLGIESYLRGVVTWEIGVQPEEVRAAVEAQAVAARTYVQSRLGQFDAQGFDVFADERDQVYKGALRDDPTADRAIAATHGLVLESGGGLIQAYYSSTCGGYTSWIEHVWPKPAARYLVGQRDASGQGPSFCAASKHFRWTEAWSGAELERTLQETLPRTLQLPAGTRIGGLVDLRVADRDGSGRVLDLEVQTNQGTWHVRGDSIRWVLKPRDRGILRSLMFDLDVERGNDTVLRVVARGGGNGHGVGMCQMGALGMARVGYDRNAILAHYYPGTSLQRTD